MCSSSTSPTPTRSTPTRSTPTRYTPIRMPSKNAMLCSSARKKALQDTLARLFSGVRKDSSDGLYLRDIMISYRSARTIDCGLQVKCGEERFLKACRRMFSYGIEYIGVEQRESRGHDGFTKTIENVSSLTLRRSLVCKKIFRWIWNIAQWHYFRDWGLFVGENPWSLGRSSIMSIYNFDRRVVEDPEVGYGGMFVFVISRLPLILFVPEDRTRDRWIVVIVWRYVSSSCYFLVSLCRMQTARLTWKTLYLI